MIKNEAVLILDFGGQYSQLIARRVRDCNVFCEIKPYNISAEEIQKNGYKGIIFSGGPNSVYTESAPKCDTNLFHLGIPVLGICYGAQLIAATLGGTVDNSEVKEYGNTEVTYHCDSVLFQDIDKTSIAWMSHTDYISALPAGFTATATTSHCPVAAMEHSEKKIFALQFHPEVEHSVAGNQILKNFLYHVCGCKGDWEMASFAKMSIESLKEKIGDKIKDAEVYYVFQENDNITKYVSIPKNRIKPLGTGHCVYSAKDVIKEKFAVINADDFYGRTSFMNLSKELDKDSNDFYIVGYPLNKTISNYGSVKRGVCNIKESEVTSIDECVIEKNKDVYNAKVINTDKEIKVNDNTIVSMGMYGLNPSIFDFMEKDIIEFFNKFKDDKDKEYFLPDVVTKMSNENKVKIKIITTNSDWFGITYKEELESVKEKISKLIEDKVYPSKLF